MKNFSPNIGTVEINENFQERKIKEISNLTEIKIKNKENNIEQENIEQENIEQENIEQEKTLKGKKRIKRTSTLSKIPQLNEFSDSMLQYEMKRMMGI